MTFITRNGHVLIGSRTHLANISERNLAEYTPRENGFHMAEANTAPRQKHVVYEEQLTDAEREVFKAWGYLHDTDQLTIRGWYHDYRKNLDHLRDVAQDKLALAKRRILTDDAATITTAVNRLGG